MKYIEINQKFTGKVTEYLSKGYILNTATMNGSQGEISHIDLTNGTEIIRVLLERDIEHDECDSYNCLSLIVGKVTDEGVHPNSSADWQTVWNNRLEVIERESFYELYQKNGERIYGSKDEAQEIHQKQFERYCNRRNSRIFKDDVTTDSTRKIVTPAIKRKLGVKRVDQRRIQVRKSGSTYRVIYGNRDFILA